MIEDLLVRLFEGFARSLGLSLGRVLVSTAARATWLGVVGWLVAVVARVRVPAQLRDEVVEEQLDHLHMEYEAGYRVRLLRATIVTARVGRAMISQLSPKELAGRLTRMALLRYGAAAVAFWLAWGESSVVVAGTLAFVGGCLLGRGVFYSYLSIRIAHGLANERRNRIRLGDLEAEVQRLVEIETEMQHLLAQIQEEDRLRARLAQLGSIARAHQVPGGRLEGQGPFLDRILAGINLEKPSQGAKSKT